MLLYLAEVTYGIYIYVCIKIRHMTQAVWTDSPDSLPPPKSRNTFPALPKPAAVELRPPHCVSMPLLPNKNESLC